SSPVSDPPPASPESASSLTISSLTRPARSVSSYPIAQRWWTLDIVPLGRGASGSGLLATPAPPGDLGHVVAVLADVLLVLDRLVADRLLRVRRSRPQLWQPVDHVGDQVEAIEVVPDRHVERRGGRSLLLVSADVQVVVVRTVVREPVDEPGVAVEGEDD